MFADTELKKPCQAFFEFACANSSSQRQWLLAVRVFLRGQGARLCLLRICRMLTDRQGVALLLTCESSTIGPKHHARPMNLHAPPRHLPAAGLGIQPAATHGSSCRPKPASEVTFPPQPQACTNRAGSALLGSASSSATCWTRRSLRSTTLCTTSATSPWPYFHWHLRAAGHCHQRNRRSTIRHHYRAVMGASELRTTFRP